MKLCTKCKIYKPLSYYTFRKDTSSLQRMCKLCIYKRQKKYRLAHPEYYTGKYRRKYHLKNKYRLTEEEYRILLDKQEGRCSICGTGKPGNRHGTNSFFIDHCHETQKVRGLLCQSCNQGLGHFKDSPHLLKEAIRYLDDTNKEEPRSTGG